MRQRPLGPAKRIQSLFIGEDAVRHGRFGKETVEISQSTAGVDLTQFYRNYEFV